MLQTNRTKLLPIVQQATFNLALQLKKFFAQIHAKKESDANGNFKQHFVTDIFMKRAYFNSA